MAAAAILASSTFAPESGAETTVGVRAGYNTRSESPVAGLLFQYSFSDHVRIAPNADYYFRNNDLDALSISCNMEFPFALSSTGNAALYPLAGLNYSSWNYHLDKTGEEFNDVSTRVGRLGLNVGAGFEYKVTRTLKLSVEAVANLMKSYSSGSFTASIAYVF